MSTNPITDLSEDEFFELRRITKKLWTNRAEVSKLPPRYIKELRDEFASNFSERPIVLSRVSLRVLIELTTMAADSLQKTIIPGYKGRMKTKEDRIKYTPYVQKSETFLKILIPLIEKLRGAL